MIRRSLLPVIESKLFKGKAIIILGARQTGKTTLIKVIEEQSEGGCLYLNCDDPFVQSILEEITTNRWKQIIGNNRLVFIDEAQRIKNIGIKLKLVTDQMPEVQVVVTGSSSLELANEINEPLTGRKWEYNLFPISWGELKNELDFLNRNSRLEERLIYGMYPEVVVNQGSERELLIALAGSYLYRDLLSFSGIRKPELLDRLLKALALQIGNEVSFNELSNLLGVDKNTVMNYLDLLEKAFIVFRLQPLSRNLRNEISSSRKVYFYDNGIRNAIIANFNPLNIRNDAGALWENFLISERLKANHYNGRRVNYYFWRTHQRQEIDYIEEFDGKFNAYEFKWSPRKKFKMPATFTNSYEVSSESLITKDNFEEFI